MLFRTISTSSLLLSALDCIIGICLEVRKQKFSDINQLENKTLTESSITISIAEIDEQIRKIENSSWNKFKVKCNGFNLKNTEKIVEFKPKYCARCQCKFHQRRLSIYSKNILISEINVHRTAFRNRKFQF